LHAAERSKHLRDLDLSNVDFRSLSLRVLDVVIEEMGLGSGAARDEVVEALGRMLASNAPTIEAADAQVIADLTVDALLNETHRRQAFSELYIDWTQDEPVSRELLWHLLREVELPDGRFVLRATTEGINVYTGMLEYDVQDAQVAEEAVLHAQVKRGRIRDAVRTAQNARLRSIEYQETLGRVLRLVQRDVAQVSWHEDMAALLDGARDHLDDRLETERQLVDMVSQRVDDASDADAPRLAELIDILQECQGRHFRLHREVIQASNVFLDEQERQYFRPREILRLPDLEADVLAPALELASGPWADRVGALMRCFIPASAQALLYVPQLADRLLAPPRAEARPDTELEEIVLEAAFDARPFFDAKDEAHVEDVLSDLPEGGASLSSLLDRLRQAEGTSRAESLLVLTLLRTFDPSAEPAGGVRAEPARRTLNDLNYEGDDLVVLRTNRASSEGTAAP